MSFSCTINFDDILSEHWYYHIVVSVCNCVDFVLSIVMLIEVDQFDTSAWFWLLIVVMATSRFICTIAPFNFYTSTVPRMESGALLWRLYSAVMLFFFSSFHCLYHAGFKNEHLLNLLCLRERKSYKVIKNVSTNDNLHISEYQAWVNNAVKIHIFHSFPHCCSQAIPQCILYYSIILHEHLTFDHNQVIFCIFFVNLFSIIVTSPIWCCKIYYALSVARDHYHIWSFIFNTFAIIVDVLGVLYIIAYIFNYYTQLDVEQWPSYDTSRDPLHRIIYVLWWYQFCFICLTSIISATFMAFVSLGFVLQDIFKTIDSFKCQEICGGCLTISWSLLVAPIAALQCIMLIFNALIVLNVFCFSWVTFLTLITIQRFGSCSQSIFWCDLIEWIKIAKNKNDLLIRLSCCNYHLQDSDIKQRIQHGIIDSYEEEKHLGFSDIRIHSSLSDFSWFPFVNKFVQSMASMPHVLSLSFRLCILLFGIPYIFSRIIVMFLPLVAFILLHFKQWDNFMTFLSFIYSIFLIVMLYMMDKVLWHSWILLHILPAKKTIDCIGLHNSCMPQHNTLYAVKTSYQNIQNAMCYRKKIKHILCESIQLNEYHKNEDGLILCAPLKIVYNVIAFLPGKSAYVDYVKVGDNKDNDENPLLKSVDTSFFYNEGTV